jgi:hypothetical protein
MVLPSEMTAILLEELYQAVDDIIIGLLLAAYLCQSLSGLLHELNRCDPAQEYSAKISSIREYLTWGSSEPWKRYNLAGTTRHQVPAAIQFVSPLVGWGASYG